MKNLTWRDCLALALLALVLLWVMWP